MKSFQLDIVTPESSVYSGRVESVTVPGTDGQFQILYNHAPIISTLGSGKVVLVDDEGNDQSFDAKGGVIEVMKNKAIILVEQIVNQEATA